MLDGTARPLNRRPFLSQALCILFSRALFLCCHWPSCYLLPPGLFHDRVAGLGAVHWPAANATAFDIVGINTTSGAVAHRRTFDVGAIAQVRSSVLQ